MEQDLVSPYYLFEKNYFCGKKVPIKHLHIHMEVSSMIVLRWYLRML